MNPLEKLAESIDSGINHLLVQRDQATSYGLQEIEKAVEYSEQVAVMTAKTALSAESISVNTVENTGQHDNLATSFDSGRKTEVKELNQMYNAASAPEKTLEDYASKVSTVNEPTPLPVQPQDKPADDGQPPTEEELLKIVYGIHERNPQTPSNDGVPV